jgi:glucokinase
MSEIVIGIDLGGTNMRAAAVDSTGRIIEHRSVDTPVGRGSEAFVSSLAEMIDEVSEKQKIECVGVAVANAVHVFENRLSLSPNIPDLNNFDLAGALREETGLEVYLDNDATAAAVAEHWLGAGRGTDHMICITLGTGVGGGIIVDNKPLYGADGTAGEVGHVCLDRNGPPCGCGSNGCLEQYSSGTAIVRMTKELLPRFPESVLHSKLEFSAKDVYDAAIEGDAASVEAYAQAGRYLGTAIAGLANIFNPNMVVLSGGVAAAWELFIGPTREELKKRAFQQPAERVKIVRGTLGDDAGVLGAAKRAFSVKGFS